MRLIRLAFSTVMHSWRAPLLFILTITVLLVTSTALISSVNVTQVPINSVAGVSSQEMLGHAEGIPQSWATVVIAEGWNLVQLLIAILFMFVGFVFLGSRIAFWQLENARREALLIDIGWKKRDVKRYASAERNILLGISIILAVMILSTVISLGGLTTGVWKMFFLVALLICLLGSLFALYKRQFNKGKRSIHTTSLPLHNIWYYRNYISYSALQLLFVNILVVFIVGFLSVNRPDISATLRGEFLGSSLGPLLLITLIAAIGFTIMTTIDGQETMRRVRLQNLSTLRAIGWRSSSIKALWVKETLIWTLPVLLMGSGIGCALVILAFEWSALLVIQAVSVFIVLLMVTIASVFLGVRRVIR